MPIGDVRADLHPSPTQTYCAYEGLASYWSLDVAGRAVVDMLWGYAEPLQDASTLTGHVCFLDVRTDLVVDGTPRAGRSHPGGGSSADR